MKVGLYARVSTHDQNTLPMQIKAMRKYAKSRRWKIVFEAKDTNSGISKRTLREELLKLARQREIDVVLVWRLDRWGRSVTDLLSTLQELGQLGIGFISLTEALDLTTATGKAMAGLLAVFSQFERDILRERVKSGIAFARKNGKPHGRPKSAANKATEVKKLFKNGRGFNKSEIARKLKISRTSVRRILDAKMLRNSAIAG